MTPATEKRLALIAASKIEAAAITEWKKTGSIGDAPATPALDELGRRKERRPSKGTKMATQVSEARAKAAAKRTAKKATDPAPAKQGSLYRKTVTPRPKKSTTKKASR